MIMAVPASIGILLSSKIMHSKYMQLIAIILVVSFFSFFSITNTFVNIDSPIYTENTLIRYNFYDSENTAITTMLTKYDGIFSLDYYYLHPLIIGDSGTFVDLSDRLIEGNFTNTEGLVIIRDEITKRPFNANGIYRLNYDLKGLLEQQKGSMIYSSDSVYGYLFQ